MRACVLSLQGPPNAAQQLSALFSEHLSQPLTALCEVSQRDCRQDAQEACTAAFDSIGQFVFEGEP